jgi:4-amino-4-deoxy-L-arabinose transferase-like glycosyltransferase
VNRVREFIPVAVVTLAAIFLVVVKWQHLFLPCFVDEAYPYAPALRYLTDHHLSIMPNAIPSRLSTGHPPAFHFFAAAWMKIFGAGMFAAHLFPLLISVVTLFMLYRFGKTFFNAETGALAVLLFVTRAVFVAQSSQLLPETMVTLFTILAIHSWLQNRKWIYVLWASLLVLTKESGLVLPAALCLWEIISFFRYRQISIVGLIKTHYHTALPFLAALLFFIVQRIQMGWFFFPMHIGLMSFSTEEITKKLTTSIGAQLFVFMGGIATTILLVLSIGIFIVRKMKLSPVQRRSIGVLLLFMVCFIVFSCLNFYSPRYILCLYPLLYIIMAYVLLEALKGIPKIVPVTILVCVAFFQLWYTFNFKTNTDSDLGYADAVKTQYDAVRWCEENGYQHKNICAPYQLQCAMTSDAAGFVNKKELFSSVNAHYNEQTDLFIFTCNEYDASKEEARKLPLKTIVKFQSGKAWTEICKLK